MLRPWLLEVNLSPSMQATAAVKCPSDSLESLERTSPRAKAAEPFTELLGGNLQRPVRVNPNPERSCRPKHGSTKPLGKDGERTPEGDVGEQIRCLKGDVRVGSPQPYGTHGAGVSSGVHVLRACSGDASIVLWAVLGSRQVPAIPRVKAPGRSGSLSCSCEADSPLDWQIKSSLLSDSFNLVSGLLQPSESY